MNGPEHYHVAEKLLDEIEPETTVERAQAVATVAQVHANLAHAAAVIDAAHSWNVSAWSRTLRQPTITNGGVE